jgi:plastocyanin
MKGSWWSCAVLTATILAGSSPLLAHDECDDVPQAEAASAESGESVGPRSQSGSAVTIQLFQYQPAQLEIKAGTTVTWVNQDDIQHTVTLGTRENPNGAVNLSLSGKSATASFTFDRPGEYEYFCDRHQSMRGRILVK